MFASSGALLLALLLTTAYSTPLAGPEDAAVADIAAPEAPQVVEVPEGDARSAGNEVHLGAASRRETAFTGKLERQCGGGETASCMLLKLLENVDRLVSKKTLRLADDLEITETSAAEIQQDADVPAGAQDALVEEDPEAALVDVLASKARTFLRTRSLRWAVLPSTDVLLRADPSSMLGIDVSFRPAVNQGRGKKTAGLAALLAAAVMKMGLVGGLGFKALALLVGKAIVLSKIAFLLAGLIWLKKLFGGGKYVTYEVVSHPHHGGGGGGHDYHGDSYSSGWARSHELAFRGQRR